MILLDRFFLPLSCCLAPRRVEKPSFLPLFAILAKTLQEAKSSQKNSGSRICAPARRELIARPPPPKSARQGKPNKLCMSKISWLKRRRFDAVFRAICFDNAASPKTGRRVAYSPKCIGKIWREFPPSLCLQKPLISGNPPPRPARAVQKKKLPRCKRKTADNLHAYHDSRAASYFISTCGHAVLGQTCMYIYMRCHLFA